jgi:hypothetical protein
VTPVAPEDQVIRLCARQRFLDAQGDAVRSICRDRSFSWEQVRLQACRHGVGPLVHVNLRKCVGAGLDIPLAVMGHFQSHAYHNRARKEMMARTVEALLDHFRERGIAVMLIKGLAADLAVYDRPWYTASGDIDMVLKAAPGTVTDKEITAAVGGRRPCVIEWQPWEHHDVTVNGSLPVDFGRIWADAVKVDYHGREATLMSPEDRLITACISSGRWRFQRLKQLCDLAETVGKFEDARWERVLAKAGDYDCAAIVYAGLLVARLALDCAVPDAVLAGLPVGRAKRALLAGLCRRQAAAPLKAWNTGLVVRGRTLSPSLILPYLAWRPYQLRRRMRWETRRR